MPPLRRALSTGSPLLAASLAGVAVAALLPATAGAIGAPQAREGRAPLDVRVTAAATAAPTPSAARSLQRRLGTQGVVRIDPVTGTPRQVARTDGSLTGPSSAPAEQIALDYVRAHPGLFKLSDVDLAALGAPEQIVSPNGTRHLRWRQQHGGVPVLGAELRAHVAADGRLLAVQGSPLPDTSVPTTAPALSASSALARVRRDVGASGPAPRLMRSHDGPLRRATFADDSLAQLVVFAGPDGNRLAWRVVTEVDRAHVYTAVVDAVSGEVLKRDNLVRNASGHAAAWRASPRDPLAPIAFPERWVTDGSALRGDYAWVYPDLLDADAPVRDSRGNGGEVEANGPPAEDGKPVWDYTYTPITTVFDPDDPEAGGGYQCSVAYPCSWSSWLRYSWDDNVKQNAVQVFTYVNRFHDHLAQPPIGFDAASGNFEVTTPGGTDGDPVIAQTSDGASIDVGYPDGDHFNNANMATYPDTRYPDGRSPRMQLYLFAATTDPADPTVDGNSGDDASVVYHEYTHGLSSRLITDSDGWAAVSTPQAGAMGEGWSDWYALDYLTATGDMADSAAPGELVLAGALTQGKSWLRSAAMDCPVDVSDVPECPAGGGYTYEDFGHVGEGGPQVHTDGEIWSQTLWDLRTALRQVHGELLGTMKARSLVTEAMRTSPPQPSFIEMRDQILLADEAVGRPDHDLIWQVFAARGMGAYADSASSLDPSPIASFKVPPPADAPRTSLSGTVTDASSGTPVSGALVWLPGGKSSAMTGADGRYAIAGVPADTYPRLNVSAAGYADPEPVSFSVGTEPTTHDVTVRRNWALSSGGSEVTAATAPDLSHLACGPEMAVDGTKGWGWASYAPDYTGGSSRLPLAPTGERSLTLRLPRAVDVTAFEVDPGAICGDSDGASLGRYRIETSPDAATWTLASSGTFTPAQNHRMNTIIPRDGSTAAARYVRLTMESPQDPDEVFMDLAELGVYGTATVERGPEEPRRPEEEPRRPEGQPRQPELELEPRPRPRADTRKPRSLLKPAPPKRKALTALRSRAGMPVKVRFDEATRVAATVTLPAATARRLGLTRARRGTFRLSSAGIRRLAARKTGTVRLKLRPAVRRKLARARSFRVTLTVTATDGARNRTRIVAKPLLRR